MLLRVNQCYSFRKRKTGLSCISISYSYVALLFIRWIMTSNYKQLPPFNKHIPLCNRPTNKVMWFPFSSFLWYQSWKTSYDGETLEPASLKILTETLSLKTTEVIVCFPLLTDNLYTDVLMINFDERPSVTTSIIYPCQAIYHKIKKSSYT